MIGFLGGFIYLANRMKSPNDRIVFTIPHVYKGGDDKILCVIELSILIRVDSWNDALERSTLAKSIAPFLVSGSDDTFFIPDIAKPGIDAAPIIRNTVVDKLTDLGILDDLEEKL